MDHRTPENKKLFLTTFEAKAANISMACKAIGISRQAYYNWYSDDEEFRGDVDNIRESLCDIAESQLMKNVLAGKEASLFFLLTNKRPDQWKQKLMDVRFQNNNNILNVHPDVIVQQLKDKYGERAEHVAKQLASVLGISLEVRPSQNGAELPVRALPG